MSSLLIQWLNLKTGHSADAGRLAPGTPVRLQSKLHSRGPSGYDIFEVVPKFLHKWGEKRRHVKSFDAVPGDDSFGFSSVYSSDEDWDLAGPAKQTREAVFEPALREPLQEEFDSVFAARIRSSYLFISKATRDRRLKGSFGFGFSLDPAPEVTLGALSGEIGREDVYEGRVATDPSVQVELLQGGALLDHLVEVAEEFRHDSQTTEFLDLLGSAAPTYFAGQPLPDQGSEPPLRLEPFVPLWIKIRSPAVENLRAAYAVVLRDIDDGAMVVSDPAFLTAIRGRVVQTDLPVELLSDQATDVLNAFADANFDVEEVAIERGQSRSAVWDALVTATLELGAESVEDAAAFAQLGRPKRQPELVPA